MVLEKCGTSSLNKGTYCKETPGAVGLLDDAPITGPTRMLMLSKLPIGRTQAWNSPAPQLNVPRPRVVFLFTSTKAF
jgi:hypothetical protein